MDFLEIMQNRYTSKVYDPTKKVSDADIEKLKHILRLSPSSINSQPWKFTFVSDEAVKKELAEHSWINKERVINASHIVIFSAVDNLDVFEKHIENHLAEMAANYYAQNIKVQSEGQIKAWLQHQVYLSLGVFLSACATMGIDSTPMEGIENDAYGRIANIENYRVLFAVAIGYRDTDDANQPSLNPKSRLDMDLTIKDI